MEQNNGGARTRGGPAPMQAAGPAASAMRNGPRPDAVLPPPPPPRNQYGPGQPTYWSENRWGASAKPLAAGPAAQTPMEKKASKYFHTPAAPIPQPDASVFATLNDLETLMRSTLAALANFNEDERMILVRQLRREGDRARERGEYSPPGLLNVGQFRHAFKKFSIRVSEEQACALFIKYGCDTQGLLPLDMFAAKLLASPARLLALEPEQKGPYKSGRDASFRGKIVYRYCRRPVFPPSNWDGTPAVKSAKKPKAGLKLEHVYGYAGHNNTTNNLFWTADYKIVYYLAALGIVYDPVTHTQAFYEGHDNDIRCLAMHPNRTTVATGQMANALDAGPNAGGAAGVGVGDVPFVCVWDTRDLSGTIRKISFPSDGESAAFIVALCFSADGELLIIVTGDTKHTLYIYDLVGKAMLHSEVGYSGTPPSVYGVVWNQFYRQPLGGGEADRYMFVSYGKQHIRIWSLDLDKRRQPKVTSVMGKFGKYQVHDVMSAIFINAETVVTGAPDGRLLIWDMGGTTSCIQEIKNAHGPGAKAPNMYDNQPTLQGVRALCLRANDTELCSGGSDGVVYCWDLSGGGLGPKPRIVKKMELTEVGESSTRCSFRSLDARPGSYDLVAGTNRCEIWDLAKDIPEVLVQGHTDTVLGVAFHPKRPHKFATVCDSSNVYLWNAKRRQLMAKVGIGVRARCVTFSPNGAHLAIGTAAGGVKVLQVESLTTKVAEMQHAKEEMSTIRYSPDGTKLAVGSHDNFIYVYNAMNGYQKLSVCKGHSSYITHLDWSIDSRMIQSNCGAYELLYFEAATGKLIFVNQRDALWDTWTCVLGFSVMGIWQKDTDGTDINSCSRSFQLPAFQETDVLVGEDQYVVAAYDDGMIRLFAYPCVIEHAPCRAYVGHASHVMGVRFSPDNQYVVSAGGYDRGAMQWRVLPTAHDDVVMDKPDFGNFKVYQPPKRQAMEPDVLVPGPGGPAVGPAPGEDASAAADADRKRREELEKAKKANLFQYEITTYTSNIKGAGTDCGVALNVIGSGGASGSVVLENAPDNFTRGKVDVFKVDLRDLGTLQRCMVSQDGKGNQPRWHLQGLTITNKTAKTPSVNFPCGMWFAKDIGDGLTTRTLFPGGSADPGATRRYSVAVKTSNLKGAGTDASVYLTLYGQSADKQDLASPNFKLDNSPDNFSRDITDRFEVDAAVGQLTHIKIGHDNNGLAPQWHLQDVVVTSLGMEPMQFVANRWLSTDENLAKDKQTYVTLWPGGDKAAPGQIHKYRIHVFTSDIKGAGTDANVTIILFGSNGVTTPRLKLESSKNNFERGQEDVFYHEYQDLADIVEVEIEHDNKGLGPSWHCQEVVVFDLSVTPNKRFAFPCDRWLAVDEDDHLIRRRLQLERGGETTSYRVMVYTGDIKGAGTDANVYMMICGARAGQEPTWGPENQLSSSKNDFERGEKDEFWLKKHRNMGELRAIRIRHDNRGLGAAWYLDHVEVIDDATGVDYYFPCSQWFDKDAGDRQIDRVLPVAQRDANAAICQYKIEVFTSDVKFAGTDANVHIQILGEKDGRQLSTPVTKLSSSKNDFERGARDTFNLELPSVGTMHRIVIGHDNKGIGADWHLQMVEITCVQTGQFARFHYNDWLPPPNYEVELLAEGEAQQLPSRYTVKTYTSDIRYAGTDANVHIVMHGELPNGEKTKSPILMLANSKNNFERAEEDEFVVQTADVGKITLLEIGHDNSGMGAAWHLEHVEIWHQGGAHYYFWADRWLDKALGTDVIFLEPTSAADQKQLYKVTVKTGDQRGAGTDADISVILIGDNGTSDERKLDNSKNNFERDMTDIFTLDLGKQDLGRIHTLDIGFATQQSAGGKIGSLFGKAWNLQMAEVAHLNVPDQLSVFVYDDWINGDKRRVQLREGKVGVNNTYKVCVRTSDIRGAGTDSNITICICGTRDGLALDTGDQKLDDAKNNFERNMTDVFMVKTIDVGELTSVVVKSDGSGFGAAWHLDQVEILDTVRRTTTVFPCGEWLDPKDPMSLTKTLLPRGVTGAVGSLVPYKIAIRTSDVRGAGTDADVTIELYGEKNHTPAIKLDTAANNFERNMTDRFEPKAIDVGPLTHIFISKTGGGLGGDWHLQEVEVFHPVVQKTYYFLHNDWLKGAVRIMLEPGKVPENGRCTYKVVVKTADERGAGTDANVTMVLTGDKGDTGERKLDTSANDFERNQEDTFYIEAPDVGRFIKLVMAHDNTGFGAAWKLAWVNIVNTNTGEQAIFPCNRWLDKEHGLSVTLTPDRDGDGVGDALEGGPETDYTVTVWTSDIRGAGTDANVFIELYGKDRSLGERRLDDHKNNFERNMRDVFRFKASDVGDIEKLVIRHDNTGVGPDWHLQQIEVSSAATGKTYFFPCNAWLRKEGNDMSGCRKELFVGNPDSSGPTNYHIEVYTSDIRGAGTDADVWITIFGEKGDTGQRVLNNPMKNNFEKGQKDEFFLTSPNVGMMHYIKIRSSGSGLGAPWHLARVVITSAATGECLSFPFNNWIDKEHGLEKEIWPDRDGDGIGDVDASQAGHVKYRVNTYTSEIRGAGTDANVAIEIHGEKAFIGATTLETHGNNFEKGQKDEFDVTGTDVGPLTKIVIGHDNSGLGAAWHLAQVEVFHPTLQPMGPDGQPSGPPGVMYVFPCNEWLEFDKNKGGLENCKRELLVGAAAAASGLTMYKVMVQTSNERGAGTDADVFLTIYGPKGDTGEQELAASGNNFERNKLDTFIIKGPDIAEPDRIRVRSDGGGLGAAWHLSHIDIVSSAYNNTVFHFPFNNWIDKKNGLDVTIYRDGVVGAGKPLQEYRVTTYTSDIRGAGTDANVFIELHGELGTVGQNRLETHGNNFERAQMDTFVVKGTDVGDLTKVVIWHDNSGPGPAWHLQHVEVFNPATQRTYFFPCNQWLEKTREEGEAGCKKVLLAGGAGGPSHSRYKVDIKTSDERGAGTDANVTIQVFGALGDSGEHKLDDSKNNFERNMLDTFFFEAPDIGEIVSCVLKCDGSGMGAAWALDFVVVTNTSTGQSARFSYKGWFDDKSGWTHTLYPEGMAQIQGLMVPYRVTVYTSDIRGAGTGGEVYISMKGTKGSSGETQLQAGRDAFSQNRTDTFEITASEIGAIEELTVRLVEKGLGAPWHFKEIEVLNLQTGALARFLYNDWLQKTQENPTATVVLREASLADQKAGRQLVQWRVVTQTSNIFGAGTDATVVVQIWGPAGVLSGGEIALNTSKNDFERNGLDTFFLEYPVELDCGYPVNRLVVERQESLTPGADWHLDWIEITDTTRGHTYKWRCGHWFDKKEGLKKEWSVDAVMAGTPLQLELVEAPAGPEKPLNTKSVSGDYYKIDVVTGDKFGAGTDATVRMNFTDVQGQIWQPMFAQQPSQFQRRATAHLEASSLHPLGELVSCRVWLEQATVGLGDAWQLDHVIVTHLPSNRAWRFQYGNWVPKEGAVMQAQVINDVPQSGAAPERPDVMAQLDQMHRAAAAHVPPPPTEYSTQVWTGSRMYAGTDALITMEVTGTWGKATHSFDQSKDLFERGSKDHFLVRVPDCGALHTLRVWHDGSGFGADWFLERIQITSSEHNCAWEAVFNAWVKGGEDKGPTRALTCISGTPPQGPYVPPPPPPQQDLVQQWQPTLGGVLGVVRPGDPGVHPQVLDTTQFHGLPGMQAGDPRQRISQDQGLPKEPPPGEWQQYTAPDGRPYFHNARTGQSTYDKPGEYAAWEAQHGAWAAQVLGPRTQGTPAAQQGAQGPQQGGDGRVAAAAPPQQQQQQPAAGSVLDHAQFHQLQAMQPGDPALRLSRTPSARPEPTCEWQQYSAPHPQDASYTVDYYHNARTGQSTYDKPPEFAAWEKLHEAWRNATIGGRQ